MIKDKDIERTVKAERFVNSIQVAIIILKLLNVKYLNAMKCLLLSSAILRGEIGDESLLLSMYLRYLFINSFPRVFVY